MVKYMAAREHGSRRVIAIGIAGDQAGREYPIQGKPKLGIWMNYVFTEIPEVGEDQQLEFDKNCRGFIVV